MSERPSSSAKGYDRRWQAARDQYLAEHPLCVGECRRRGVLTPATVVDHIVPHRMGQALASGEPEAIRAARRLFWDKANWQALCKRCHDGWKQRQEKGGSLGCDASGIPASPAHHWNRPA